MDGYPFVAVVRFDAPRVRDFSQSLTRTDSQSKRARYEYHSSRSFVRVPSVHLCRSSSVVRGIHVRSKTLNIDPSSAARAPLETRAPTLLLATLTTRRRHDTNEPRHKSKDVPCARKVFHRRASVRVSQTRRQVKHARWARRSKTQTGVGSICMNKQ